MQYVSYVEPKGGTNAPFANAEKEESFIYVISGKIDAETEGKTYHLTEGGYLYAAPGKGICFTNVGDAEAKILLYKQLYIPYEGKQPYAYSGNVNEIAYSDYDGMANVHIKDLLPVDQNFDMNMHILSFEPGGCHPIVETHVQEHGMYILEGEGMYLLDDIWMGIKEQDFIWFGAYAAQCAYGVGLKRSPTSTARTATVTSSSDTEKKWHEGRPCRRRMRRDWTDGSTGLISSTIPSGTERPATT